MNGKTLLGAATLAAAIGVAGCAQPGGGYGYGAPATNPGYQTSGAYQAPAGSVFYGRVEAIEPVQQPRGASSGMLGTVIGGLAGGLLGHQIGGGRGQTIATIGGAVAGGVAGNQIEQRATGGMETVYRVHVRLDDGRMATVTQRQANNLRVGDRVQVANDTATPIGG